MRKRNLTLLFFAFLLFSILIINSRFDFGRTNMSMEDSLIKSMESTNAKVMESTISAWGQINSSFMTEEQVGAEINAILGLIKPDSSTINIVKEASEDICKQTINANSGNKFYNIAVESIKTEKGGETYVIMDVSIDSSDSELVAERQKLEGYFETKTIKPKVSSCIIGVYDGKLTESDMRGKIAAAMDSVKAKEIEGLTNDEVNSISAFSGNINNFVLSNNKKVNMQIAMRYSSYDDKTYIWIGSPLIHVEY